MNDVIFEIVCMDFCKYLIAFVVLVCLRVEYLRIKAVLMRKGLKGICKIA